MDRYIRHLDVPDKLAMTADANNFFLKNLYRLRIKIHQNCSCTGTFIKIIMLSNVCFNC